MIAAGNVARIFDDLDFNLMEFSWFLRDFQVTGILWGFFGDSLGILWIEFDAE